jgi:putative ABC transport system permease protein
MINLSITFKTSFLALQRNRMRSGLTMLGIIIGVAAVIIMVSVGQGAKASIESNIASMGTNVLFIGPGSMSSGGQRMGFGSVQTLTPGDAEAISKECPAVLAVSPQVSSNSPLVYGNQNWSTSVVGVSPDFFVIRDWQVTSGNAFNESDVSASAKVCVVGMDIVKNLFQGEDPVGKIIRIRNIPVKVVGVLQSKGQNMMGQNQDDTVLVPYTTVMKRILNRTNVGFIMASAVSQDKMLDAQDEIANLLRQRHKIPIGKDDDFFIGNQKDFAEMATATSTILTLLLGSVASISLIVGGIGIMNIMLVSVRERTREIGIRMAVGARGRDIMLQFLVEAIVLSAMGGLIGVALGIGGSALVSKFSQWTTYVAPWSIFVSIGFSSAIGIFFGFYPARTAARLNPIEALRYE